MLNKFFKKQTQNRTKNREEIRKEFDHIERLGNNQQNPEKVEEPPIIDENPPIGENQKLLTDEKTKEV